jgi:hypothetical protein
LQAFSQPEPVSGNIEVEDNTNPTEFTYLQTSKGIYEAGEDLWFKAYIFGYSIYYTVRCTVRYDGSLSLTG